MNPFLDSRRHLRNGWWILIFFVVMAAMLVPLIIVRRAQGDVVPAAAQLAIVFIATWICQLLRRRPLTEVVGRLDRNWLTQLLVGCALGAALMLIPAAFLGIFGFVTWTTGGASLRTIVAALPMVIAAAATEELVFRGFIFQRTIDGLGVLLAQLLLGAYFVLTHTITLATAGEVRYLGGVNIFIASLLFGFAFLRTRSLAMPLGIHFASNFTQGQILGFDVSGLDRTGVLTPMRRTTSHWLTGGAFGLEASVPCLITLIAMTWFVYRWRRNVAAPDIASTASESA